MSRTQAHGGERVHDRDPARDDGRAAPVKSSHIIAEHIDVGVPRETAYDQWTRYEDLSRYSKNEAAEVERGDRVGVSSKIGPFSRRWEAEIVEEVPGRRVVWRSVGGANHMGVASFHELDGRLTRVMVEMEYHPSGAIETIGNFLRMQRRRVRKDLRLFKNFIELRGEASGSGTGQSTRPASSTARRAAGDKSQKRRVS